MDVMNRLVAQTLCLAAAVRDKQDTLAQRLSDGVDLESRDGIEGALWNILTVSLVAAIAVAVLFVLGPKIIELGTQAVNRVQTPPW